MMTKRWSWRKLWDSLINSLKIRYCRLTQILMMLSCDVKIFKVLNKRDINFITSSLSSARSGPVSCSKTQAFVNLIVLLISQQILRLPFQVSCVQSCFLSWRFLSDGTPFESSELIFWIILSCSNDLCLLLDKIAFELVQS